jgi:hypothetical protein
MLPIRRTPAIEGVRSFSDERGWDERVTTSITISATKMIANATMMPGIPSSRCVVPTSVVRHILWVRRLAGFLYLSFCWSMAGSFPIWPGAKEFETGAGGRTERSIASTRGGVGTEAHPRFWMPA